MATYKAQCGKCQQMFTANSKEAAVAKLAAHWRAKHGLKSPTRRRSS
jgi:dihydroxyacid dehydratase/phosphogluconate dehydratase